MDNNFITPNDYVKGRGAQLNTNNRFESLEREIFLEDAMHDPEVLCTDNTTKVTEITAKSIVNKVDSPDVPANWSMNPYQGCEHGCIYCYARNSHEYWGFNAGKDFEKQIVVKTNSAQLLKKRLESRSWEASPIMLSGNTDCYQPVERKYKITRKILQTCLEYDHPVGIITKNSLVLRDLDILKQLAEKDLVHIHVSITSLNEELRRTMEPRTSSSKQRLNTVEQLSKHNIPVNVMFAPIIAGLNSDEVFDIASASANAGAKCLSYTMLRLNGVVELLFEDWIRKAFPLKANRVMNLIASAQGGSVQNTNFGERMKGKGVLAENIAQQVKLARKRYKLDHKMPEFNLDLFRGKSNSQLALF